MKAIKKKFTLSFADLSLIASHTVANMTRDAVQFATRGVNSAAITAFETLCNSFEIFPPDEVFVGIIKGITNEKNVLRNTVTADIQLISGFFLQKWGVNSGKYTSLRVKGLLKMSEADFLLTSRNVVEMANDNLSALTSIGLTQLIIDTLDDNAQLFETKLIELNSAKEMRDDKARERIELSNELYNYLTMYSQIGKLIWKNVNEAKYNDYIIYPAVHSGLSKPQNVTATYDPMNPPDITLSWDAVSGATYYEIYYNIANIGSPAGNFQLLNTFTSSPALIPSILDKRNYFKIKAKNNSKASPYSDIKYVDVTVV